MPITLRALRVAVVVAISAALSACIVAPVKVTTTTSPGAELAAVNTFALVPPSTPHPVVGSHIENQLRKTLTSMGYREEAVDQADVAVNYRARRELKSRVVNVADGYTYYSVEQEYIDGTIEIDVFGAASRELLWRGVGEIGVVSEGSRPQAAAKAVRAILAEFPSKS